MPIPQTPASVDPGPAGTFKWKGLNWRAQSYLAAQPGNVTVNSDGSLTCRQTSAGGMEIETTRGGLGYGDYYIVVDTDLAGLPAGVVWGGHFPYDNTDPKQEFDNQEASTWGSGGVKMRPHHWSDAGREVDAIKVAGVPSSNNFVLPAGGPWCNVTKWRKGRVDYFIYRALDDRDKSKLYYHGYSTTGIPTPKNSTTQHINLWQYPRTDAKRPATVRIVDFAFIPEGSAPQQPEPETDTRALVTVGTASFPVAGVDVARGTDALVVYTSKTGAKTTTNEWGVECTVVAGKVTAVANRLTTKSTTGTAIPAGGCVLSGNGTAADWLLANARVGASVTVPSVQVTMELKPLAPNATLAQVIEGHNALMAALRSDGLV